MFDFERPNIEVAEISEDKKYGRFVVEPLERGYGITLGNSLRRIMLSSLPGAAVSQVKIAGGLGFYLNTQSAFAIGLLPPDLGRNIKSIGNSALHSACVCLTDPAKLESARQIASACKVIELNLSPVFNEAFIDNMLFGNEEDEE